jgi:hypothetical protein
MLRMRPVYLHKDERIAALMLVNIIALLVYSLAGCRCRRSGLHVAGREMLYEFSPLHMVETHCWDGSILCRCMPRVVQFYLVPVTKRRSLREPPQRLPRLRRAQSSPQSSRGPTPTQNPIGAGRFCSCCRDGLPIRRQRELNSPGIH